MFISNVTVILQPEAMENQMDMMNLLPLLNSPDIATVRQIKEVVIEQLNNSKWLDVLIFYRLKPLSK